MINYREPIIVLAGPTASGKSAIAIELAKDFNGYIINADSRQNYKELKIGTAQPRPDKIEGEIWYIDGIKHYLYGHISAKDRYNLFEYQQDVQKVLDREDGLPILVGGTGLYIDCIVHNYILQKGSERNTEYSRKELEEMSIERLQSLIDRDSLDKLNVSDIKNPIRLIRAIERGGTSQERNEPLNYIYLYLDSTPEALKDRIEQRVELMFAEGLLEENGDLLRNGFTYDMSSMQSIGYKEFERYFLKEKSVEQVRDDIVLHSIQYAKRQKTWFKKHKDLVVVDNYEESYRAVLNFLRIS